MLDLFSIRTLAFVSVLVYVAFDYWDGRHIKDEREDLIQLKSLEFAHKATILVLAIMTLVYVIVPSLSAIFVLLAIILSSLYTEMAGKIYYRLTR